MKHRILILIATVLFAVGVEKANAQGIVVKTNLAGWMALAPNVGVDLCMNEYSSLEAIFYKSAVDSWMKKVNFTALQLGYRYWFDRTPMNSFFAGITATPTKYKMKTDAMLHDGYALPFGVNIGYCYPLNDRWNIEVSYRVGATYFYEDRTLNNPLDASGLPIEIPNPTKRDFLLTPANLGINISYIIK